jgi:tetratricopeptide (TPR) repeat protein
LAAAAMADMDRAIALQPRTIAVLIPRAAVLLVAARNQPDPGRARDLATLAAASYEAAFALRQREFDKLGQHNRGEYLSGLAEAWAIAGEREKSETYLRRILADLPSSSYAERASAKLGDWNDRHPLNCQSCH